MYINLTYNNIIKVQTPNAVFRILSRGQSTHLFTYFLKIIFTKHAQQKQLCSNINNNILYFLREPLSPKSIHEFRHDVCAPRWRR